MRDDEIRVKPLSDWKPETDVKLVKAFGKFVEEIGELMELHGASFFSNDEWRSRYEDELADCDAVITMIETASEGRIVIPDGDTWLSHVKGEGTLNILTHSVGKVLTILGRCQIQGVTGRDPKTGELNSDTLQNALYVLRYVIKGIAHVTDLNWDRMVNRRQAKIDTKTPWVMGTATDLLPDVHGPIGD